MKPKEEINIRFIDLDKTKLASSQKEHIREITNLEAVKIQREIKNNFDLSIHLKEHKKEGKRQKYSVHLKLEFPGQMINSGGDLGAWKPEEALHKAFSHIHNELISKFRLDSSYRK